MGFTSPLAPYRAILALASSASNSLLTHPGPLPASFASRSMNRARICIGVRGTTFVDADADAAAAAAAADDDADADAAISLGLAFFFFFFFRSGGNAPSGCRWPPKRDEGARASTPAASDATSDSSDASELRSFS